MKKALWMLLLLSTQAMSSTIAVIDSGVDVEHEDLLNNIWINSAEVANNGRDEDGNGYQDDVYGWNFAEQNNLVIDRKYLGTFSRDPYLFFELQGKAMLGTATEEEKKWMRSKVQDEEFIKEISKFGNFVHGTHVAGITVDGNDSKILSVKLIPTEVKLPFFAGINTKSNDKGIRMTLLKAGLAALAGQQVKLLEEIAAYVGDHNADVANGSFGTGFAQAKMIAGNLFKIAFQRDATEEELKEVALHFINSMLLEGRKMVQAAPKTLFVFAAGNDGSNNDEYPVSPANLVGSNVITVAATYKYDFLAPFSNYGTENVDIAAPGMLINSQIPGNEYLKVSGTSQAAPYVANVAAQIKDANPALSPKEIKAILMGTVDKKSYLTDKVRAQGIVNMERATYAAKLSLTMNVNDATVEANSNVADVATTKTKSIIYPFAVVPMPLSAQFKL